MVRIVFFIIACALAALVPLLKSEPPIAKNRAADFRSFLKEFEGAILTETALSEREKIFYEDFPGKVGRFSDGRREIIFRYLTAATRKLHPAVDCFAAIGYQTKPLQLKIDRDGNRWSCFSANKAGETLRVCERIYDVNNPSQNWTDVSAWYWSAVSAENGEWLAVTAAENADSPQ